MAPVSWSRSAIGPGAGSATWRKSTARWFAYLPNTTESSCRLKEIELHPRTRCASPARYDEPQRKKDLARIESKLAKAEAKITRLQHDMSAAASDYERLAELNAQLQAAEARRDELEEAWLAAAE